MKNIDKVTLTVGQLKRLIKESIDDSPLMTYSWGIYEIHDNLNGLATYRNVENSDHTFTTIEKAYKDGLEYLKLFDKGHYELEIWNNEDDRYVELAEIHDGKLTEHR